MNSRRKSRFHPGPRPNLGLDHSSPGETAPADETRETSSDRSTAAFGARVREDSRASTPAPLGMSLRIRIRLPSRWPAPNTPTTDTLKRPGPAEQPSTIAPELLPDREANVNRIRKAGHWASA